MLPSSITDTCPKIYIVGPSLLHSQLMALCMEKDLNVVCTCLVDLTPKNIIDTEPGKVRVFLLDCFRYETPELERCLSAGNATHTDTFHPVLFNVEPMSCIENLIKRNNVRGIFYRQDSRQIFLKGMQTILKGNAWLPRRLLSACVLSANWGGESDAHNKIPLSGREKEVLRLVATGLSNDEIAEKMCLSPHTVKTHLYRSYKKIGVANRLQATLRAAAYLSA